MCVTQNWAKSRFVFFTPEHLEVSFPSFPLKNSSSVSECQKEKDSEKEALLLNYVPQNGLRKRKLPECFIALTRIGCRGKIERRKESFKDEPARHSGGLRGKRSVLFLMLRLFY